jgi:hypothetical protein
MSERKLVSLLQQKRTLFETILDLTESESDLAVKAWIINLKQKELILSCIDDVDDEIQKYKSHFSYLSEEVTGELERIKHLVAHILHLDSENLKKRKQGFHDNP